MSQPAPTQTMDPKVARYVRALLREGYREDIYPRDMADRRDLLAQARRRLGKEP